jgi:hypothetical protein
MPASGSSTSPVPVGAPILGKLHGGAGELAGILLELGFQPLEQREGVGSGAGEAADHVALAEPADLLGVGLDNCLADGDLPVATYRHCTALADGQYGGAVPRAGQAGFGMSHAAGGLYPRLGFEGLVSKA